MEKDTKTYLLAFSENELLEVFEALTLKDELETRSTGSIDAPMSDMYKKIYAQINQRTAFRKKQEVLDYLDEYVEQEIEQELDWKKKNTGA